MIQKLFLLAALSTLALPARAQMSCVPTVGGVIPCPCGNNPTPVNRGCDNSLLTGGAQLLATGTPSLSSDNIQFNCTGIGTLSPTCANPNTQVLSALYAATGTNTTGAVWNDGVLCGTGTLYNLNIQVSAGGVYHFPLPGTTGVSAAHTAMGDPLAVGTTRYYFVAYRDTCATWCMPPLRQKSNSWTLTWTP